MLCIATDPFGAPAAAPDIRARARAGALLGPIATLDGAVAWEYTAPGPGGGRAEELVFEFPAGGPQSVERLALALTGETVASAELQVAPQPVFAGGAASATLFPRDAHGRPAAVVPRLGAERGALAEMALESDGSYRASYRAPQDAGDWSDCISGEVLPAAGSVAARLELSRSSGELAARAAALDGSPVEGVSLAVGASRARTGADGVARFALPVAPRRELSQFEVRAVDRPSLRALGWFLPTRDGLQLFPEVKPPSSLRLERTVALAPAAPVDLRIEIKPAGAPVVRVRALDARGAALGGRELALELLRPGGAPVAHGPARPLPDGSVAFDMAERLSGNVTAVAVDVASGVSAAREASFP